MSPFEIPEDDDVRTWCNEQISYDESQEKEGGPRKTRAHPAYFGRARVAVAGRDHVMRSPRAALVEGAELILAGLLLLDHEEQVRTRTYAEARDEVLALEKRLEDVMAHGRAIDGDLAAAARALLDRVAEFDDRAHDFGRMTEVVAVEELLRRRAEVGS